MLLQLNSVKLMATEKKGIPNAPRHRTHPSKEPEGALRTERRKKKARRVTQKLRTKVAAHTDQAPPGTKQQIGNEERLLLIARRAVQLHGFEGKPYREIARQIQEEFKLTNLPSIPTLCRWMKLGMAEFLEDIIDLQKQLRIDQFNALEDLKRRWRKAALRELNVRRFTKVNGEVIEEVDENAYKEHYRAADIFIKACARQAKLLGLDVTGNEDKADGKHHSPEEIYLYIQRMLEANPTPLKKVKRADGREVETFGNLEFCLDSGKEDPI